MHSYIYSLIQPFLYFVLFFSVKCCMNVNLANIAWHDVIHSSRSSKVTVCRGDHWGHERGSIHSDQRYTAIGGGSSITAVGCC